MEAIYLKNPYQLELKTKVKGTITSDKANKLGVITEQTVFYPESGGQPADKGILKIAGENYPVLYVEQQEQAIVHWVKGVGSLTIGSEVELAVDGAVRRDHMQQHHGQHIISAIFEQQYNWDTVGFHVGEETSTIDLAVAKVSEQALQQVELEVNRVVMQNLPVSIETFQREKLSDDLIKKVPAGQERVRLVTIPGIDKNACCGTHPSFTGEVGPIKLLKTEKVRGQVRLHFICGERVVLWMWHTAAMLQEIEQAVGASGTEALIRLEKREQELKQLQKEHKELLNLKFVAIANELQTKAFENAGNKLLVQHFSDYNMDILRGIAAAYCQKSHRIALFTGGSGPYDVVLARGERVEISMKVLAAKLLPLLNGKGGGNDDVVQGKVQQQITRELVLELML